MASTLGYLVYDAATSGNAPPSIEFHLGTPRPQLNYFLVPVSVTNRGDKTAEGVHIEVVLENDGKEQESRELAIALLARHSTREGWVTFQTDPRTGQQLQARVLSFEKP
ncbi:hypothetical protein [Nostoc sp. CHAB 5715]|uniref:hypothetical protein n=1 Tax=Nostoc sp. CHAB 5715 TaxID=2780400 RepID=UPI001E2F96CA|nr:hypothetical protein [Nostoc sp. CHAB 5715]MCC5624562.1 hypothetical protein [Nostoc sp. CHAB 5715]